MSAPKEMEFSEHLTGGEGVTGDIGGEIFIPLDSAQEQEGTLDEPVLKTLVSSSGDNLIATKCGGQIGSITLVHNSWNQHSLCQAVPLAPCRSVT